MMYLVDVNVLGEAMQSQPRKVVSEWLRGNQSELVVDPIILGEIRVGILLLPAGARRRRLEHWFLEVVETIRCVPWDKPVAMRWAKLVADLRLLGQSMPIIDSFIAATALANGYTVATRNTRDFLKAGVKVINPFLGSNADN